MEEIVNIKVNIKVLKHILREVFNDSINRESYINFIIHNLAGYNLDTFINLITLDKEYIPLKQGCYVKCYFDGRHFEMVKNHDKYIDLGIGFNKGVYGKVIKDGGWDADKKFNPYYYQMRIKYYTFIDKEDSNFEVKLSDEQDANLIHLERINKEDIPYFKIANCLNDDSIFDKREREKISLQKLKENMNNHMIIQNRNKKNK